MAKANPKPKRGHRRPKAIGPQFEYGASFTNACIVADCAGVLWWITPSDGKVTKVILPAKR